MTDHGSLDEAQKEAHLATGALDHCVGSYLEEHGRKRRTYETPSEKRKALATARRSLAEAYERYTKSRDAMKEILATLRAQSEKQRPLVVPGDTCKHRWTGGVGFRECVWCSESHPEDAQ